MKIAVFVFTRSAKFSAKFTERGGAVSGMKTFPKCHPTCFKNNSSLMCQRLSHFGMVTACDVGAVFGGDLGVNKSKQFVDIRHLLTY